MSHLLLHHKDWCLMHQARSSELQDCPGQRRSQEGSWQMRVVEEGEEERVAGKEGGLEGRGGAEEEEMAEEDKHKSH